MCAQNEASDQVQVAYFSSATNNTHRFVERLGVSAVRIPKLASEELPVMSGPFVLITPTFGAGDGSGKGAVPAPVVRFLNIEQNRAHLRGVISSGNTNFGAGFALAGDVIAQKCGVPLLYKFELLGTPQDVQKVREGLASLWTRD